MAKPTNPGSQGKGKSQRDKNRQALHGGQMRVVLNALLFYQPNVTDELEAEDVADLIHLLESKVKEKAAKKDEEEEE